MDGVFQTYEILPLPSSTTISGDLTNGSSLLIDMMNKTREETKHSPCASSSLGMKTLHVFVSCHSSFANFARAMKSTTPVSWSPSDVARLGKEGMRCAL